MKSASAEVRKIIGCDVLISNPKLSGGIIIHINARKCSSGE